MKQLLSVFSALALLLMLSCNQGKPGKVSDDKKTASADTGFTGISVYKSNGIKTKEVEYKKGIKDGLTKTYFRGGAIEQEIPYVKGVKSGMAKWYYIDGKLFRDTPFENDTINGDQIQYYKNGNKRAVIHYKEGKRVPTLEEYEMNGTKVKEYPHLTYRVNDLYSTKGVYKIFIEFSNMAEDGIFYNGNFSKGLIDLSTCQRLQQTATTGYLDLHKTQGVTDADSVHVIGAYLTPFGNRYYVRLAIPVPYKDLK